jgi:hypothetical protein
MKLSNAQSEALTTALTDTYCDALGTSATMPSADIYRRLAEGLQATDRETAPRRMLGRSDAAQIAITALFSIIENTGGSGAERCGRVRRRKARTALSTVVSTGRPLAPRTRRARAPC